MTFKVKNKHVLVQTWTYACVVWTRCASKDRIVSDLCNNEFEALVSLRKLLEAQVASKSIGEGECRA